jgi:hypothetical protein
MVEWCSTIKRCSRYLSVLCRAAFVAVFDLVCAGASTFWRCLPAQGPNALPRLAAVFVYSLVLLLVFLPLDLPTAFPAATTNRYAAAYHEWENQPIVTVAVGANTVFVVDVSTGMIRHTFLCTRMDRHHEDFPHVEFLTDVPVPSTLERQRRGSLLPLSYIREHCASADQVRREGDRTCPSALREENSVVL